MQIYVKLRLFRIMIIRGPWAFGTPEGADDTRCCSKSLTVTVDGPHRLRV